MKNLEVEKVVGRPEIDAWILDHTNAGEADAGQQDGDRTQTCRQKPRPPRDFTHLECRRRARRMPHLLGLASSQISLLCVRCFASANIARNSCAFRAVTVATIRSSARRSRSSADAEWGFMVWIS